MSTRIKCTTLFTLSAGTAGRREPSGVSAEMLTHWHQQRRSQSNFETILQVISIRSQPEDISDPAQIALKSAAELEQFGAAYQTQDSVAAWQFTFTVQHDSVFTGPDGELSALESDCDSVPVFKNLTESVELPDCLDLSPELRNIHFEKITEH